MVIIYGLIVGFSNIIDATSFGVVIFSMVLSAGLSVGLSIFLVLMGFSAGFLAGGFLVEVVGVS